MYLTLSPRLNNLLVTTDPRVSHMPLIECNGKEEEDRKRGGDDGKCIIIANNHAIDERITLIT